MKRSLLLLFSMILLVGLAVSLVSCELTTPEPSKGVLRVMAYGNNYVGTNKTLSTCENDANDFLNAMKLLYESSKDTYSGFEAIGPFHTGDKDWLETQLKAIADSEKSKENDTFVFYYSGHGRTDDESKVSYRTDTTDYTYLCPYERHSGWSATDESDYIIKNSLSFSEFLTLISEIPGRKIIILDACYSGAVNLSDGLTVNQNVWQDSSVNVFNLYNHSNNVNMSSDTFILTAARYFEVSYTANHNSAFTGKLLNAIGYNDSTATIDTIPAKSGNKLTLQGIYKYLRKNYDTSSTCSTASGGSMDVALFQF